MNYKCIKVKTFNNRIYYTEYKNIKNIKKIQNILIKNNKIVKYENQDILNINQLIKAICNHSYNPKEKNTIELDVSKRIKKFINKSFEKNKKLNFLELKKRFAKYNIKNINLYNHLNQIKKIYKKNGKEIKRTKSGIFELN